MFVDDAIINAKDRHVIAAAQFHLVDIVVSNDRRLRRESVPGRNSPSGNSSLCQPTYSSNA